MGDHWVKTCLEVDIHPGSYKVGPPTTTKSSAVVDPAFKPDQLEWSTKERGNTAVTGLLVYLEPAS